MTESTLLVIMGSFISLLLIVNAYFTRETLLRVVSLEIKIGKDSTRQQYNEKQINENTQEIKMLRNRLHSIEGYQPAILKILENN